MIQRCRDVFPIRLMCRGVQMSPSGYYDWMSRESCVRAQENARLLAQIRQRHADQDGALSSGSVLLVDLIPTPCWPNVAVVVLTRIGYSGLWELAKRNAVSVCVLKPHTSGLTGS